MEQEKRECPCLENCPLSRVMGLIGGKWKMQIICGLHASGTVRYGELQKKIKGISNTVLASCLRELEQDGLVIRNQFMEIPPRVEYGLTENAERVVPILDQLSGWMQELETERV